MSFTRWLAVLLGTALLMPRSAALGAGGAEPAGPMYRSLLAAAESGDPTAKNLVGVSLVKGDGVPRDTEAGHAWLHRAAEQGSAPALRNLGVLHSLGLDGLPARWRDYTEANAAFALALGAETSGVGFDLQTAAAAATDATAPPAAAPAGLIDPDFDESSSGERIFQRFCAGCHGFDGISMFQPVPSFSLGERLYKDDPLLLRSVFNGKGGMPSWGDKLPEESIRKAIGYLRSLAIRDRFGLLSAEPGADVEFYQFTPMGLDPFTWKVR